MQAQGKKSSAWQISHVSESPDPIEIICPVSVAGAAATGTHKGASFAAALVTMYS